MDWKEGQGPGQVPGQDATQDVAGAAGEVSGPIPAGLESLYAACRNVYPDQLNPLQVTALVKYWLGGPDPLDYISMYANPGDAKLNIPPHWHYISFGCSDLHGDGRVHEQTGPENPSGFGFELTMRLKREEGEKSPPTWPAAIMQGLAKYVFQSESMLCVGDHVSWHCPLDNSESRVQHMLMGEDPQLGTVSTPNGSVQFVQIVGITTEELRATQHWNGVGVIDIIKRLPGAGGAWMLTDMRRGESIYELDPSVAEEVENGIESEGSNLSGVSARIAWSEDAASSLPPLAPPTARSEADADLEPSPRITHVESEQIRNTLQKGLQDANKKEGKDGSGGDIEGTVPTTDSAELFVTQRLESLHLTINLESGSLLPLALRGRLKHGRHFTFKSVVDVSAVTLVPPSVAGAFVDATCPYASRGPWLQVFIPDDLLPSMVVDLADLADPDDLCYGSEEGMSSHELPSKASGRSDLPSSELEDPPCRHQVTLPATFRWPNRKLAITVVAEDM